MTGEAATCGRGAVCAAVMLGCDLDVDVILTAIGISVLDAAVGKLHVPIGVRQIVFVGPPLDLARIAIRPAVGVRSVPIALMEPPLVIAFELVVESYALDLQAALFEPRRLALEGAMDLDVVLEFPLAFEA